MLKVGDRVTWRSQANAGYKRKTGAIVLVVPPGTRVWQAIVDWLPVADFPGTGAICRTFDLRALDTRSAPRREESYVVQVPAMGRGKPKLYWPRVSQLEPAEIEG